MTLPWLPVVVVEVVGATLTLLLSLCCFLKAKAWIKTRPNDSFRYYVYLITLVCLLFAVSRSVGHLVKQGLLYHHLPHIWQLIAPYSGAINTVTFIIFFVLSCSFQRARRLGVELNQHRQHLEALVAERTAELANEQERLAAITENIPGVVYQFYSNTNGESGVSYTSSKLLDIFGLEFNPDPPTLLATFIDNIHHQDRASFVNSVEKAVAAKSPWHWQGRYIKPDGNTCWFASHSLPTEHHNGLIFNGILLDITRVVRLEQENQRAEKLLQRSQKMEAIGMMAGGVAHDLNNILSGIISYPELLLLDLAPDSPLRQPLKTIQGSGQRAAAVVADLLTVARGAAAVKEVVNINPIITEYLQTPEMQAPLHQHPFIQVKTHLTTDLLNCPCSPIHFRKCLLNLFVNACEAIGDNGTITIGTENRYVDKLFKGYDEVKQGEYVVLTVQDDGPGISTNDLEHIFEPFYSKKVMGRSGTGLGLAVVWNVMHDHNGYIDVKNTGQGTIFCLYLPATRQACSEDKDQENTQDLQGQGQTILVIDDEEGQRDIASAMLGRLGYQAKAVASGEEALEFLHHNDVDLLLLDMIMAPGMNGRQTYEKILANHPAQPAIIASGFSETAEVKTTMELGAGDFIKKPYTLRQLGRAVKAQLTKP